MAIQIELTELQRLTGRSEEITGTLTSELNRISSLLGEICSNVQSSELTGANQNLKQAIDKASQTIMKNMPIINQFLNTQIAAYKATNESAKSQIDNLVSNINANFQAK